MADVSDIDSYMGLMHTLYALEDIYSLEINSIDGELCLTLDKQKGTTYLSMFDMFSEWQQEAKRLINGEITTEEYDTWRYTYPKMEAENTKAALDARRSKITGDKRE